MKKLIGDGNMADFKDTRQEEQENRGTDEKNGRKEQENGWSGADVSETWAEETIADLDDFIESQGIYIRQ